ncbi:sensor histidine kinase [Paenibacillus sp. WST5]|uniref:histidine kinase n=1 Tax=Paenibacillus sedimenti TaxID=2770274 RepID=A0A926KK58_9BACL|nr:sensor histidine kinase [Paenibacillus sedimenti]
MTKVIYGQIPATPSKNCAIIFVNLLEKDGNGLTALLPLTRYMLILIPAIASMYLENYSSYGKFVFFTLLLIWIAELRRIALLASFSFFILLIEIGFGAWLSYSYGGLLFLTFYSTQLSYVQLAGSQYRYPCLLLQLILLNISLHEQPASHYVIANLIFIALTLLLLQLLFTSQNKEEVELVYDRLRRKHYELDEARMQLIDYARKVENIAQADERNRISRDIHDDLGHKLIRLKMMMEAGIRILPAQQQQGMDMMLSVRDQLTESMELLRATVRRLKPDEGTMQTYSLNKLIEELIRDSGITIDLEIYGMPYALYPSLEFILYRNAQEAVTNAIRHGGATQVLIELTYEPKLITMNISNNGALPTDTSIKGLGISGMEERAKVIGGQLFVSVDERYNVTTVLPAYRHAQSM